VGIQCAGAAGCRMCGLKVNTNASPGHDAAHHSAAGGTAAYRKIRQRRRPAGCGRSRIARHVILTTLFEVPTQAGAFWGMDTARLSSGYLTLRNPAFEGVLTRRSKYSARGTKCLLGRTERDASDLTAVDSVVREAVVRQLPKSARGQRPWPNSRNPSFAAEPRRVYVRSAQYGALTRCATSDVRRHPAPRATFEAPSTEYAVLRTKHAVPR